MKPNLTTSFAVVVMAAILSGCSIGNAPSGMDNDDAKAAIAKMTPEQRIKAIASSPMPGPEKQKQYEQIERESGVKASDVLGGAMQSPGAGAPTPTK